MKRFKVIVFLVLICSIFFLVACDGSDHKKKDHSCLDTDKDGVCDKNDLCPTDLAKIEPGQCGCGNLDTDRDSDGTADCIDGCPLDIAKILPGQCGCGNFDTDSDHDGTADCKDTCPNDSGKIVPGICGCGVADIDSDADGVLNCLDSCPTDRYKILPGICGCGISDIDSDSDKTADCLDQCDYDPLKIDPGDCGCGKLEYLDGDSLSDCEFSLFTPTTTSTSSGLTVQLLMPTQSSATFSLDTDSQKNVHIVCNSVGTSQIRYINNISGIWKSRNTWLPSTAAINNKLVSIDVDSLDRVHIGTIGFATTPGEDLFYISNRSGHWLTELVYDDLSVGIYPIIKTDSQNNAHIFHYKWSGAMLYSTNKTGAWVTSFIASPGPRGAGWSFTLDNFGQPHSFYSYGGIQHAYLDAGTWKIEELTSADQLSSAVSYGNTLYVACWSGLLSGRANNWTLTKIFSALDPSFYQFYFHFQALGVDSNGKLHFVFRALDDAGVANLIYLTNLTGVWNYYVLDKGDNLHWPQLAVDNSNKLHVLYTSIDDDMLHYLSFDPVTF